MIAPILSAARLHDASVWEAQQPTIVRLVGGLFTLVRRGPGADVPRSSAGDVCTLHYDTWVVYPSGLTIPLRRVPWFWAIQGARPEYRLGDAEQAVRYAHFAQLDPLDVFPVDPSFVHGTCIREEGNRLDGRDYRLVSTRPFPRWTQVNR